MKRETKHAVFLTLLAVALVAVLAVVGRYAQLDLERRKAAIWAEEMRKAGVPAGAVPR